MFPSTIFSASGSTAHVAKALAEAGKADLFEIKPEVPYTAADLNWNDKNSRSSLEMNDPTSRPAIAERMADVEGYDTIFIGFPIWWYTAPTIIHTFLESYDFSGKTILVFATSGGSGLGKTEQALKNCCSDTIVWKGGKLLGGSQQEIAAWLKTLDI